MARTIIVRRPVPRIRFTGMLTGVRAWRSKRLSGFWRDSMRVRRPVPGTKR